MSQAPGFLTAVGDFLGQTPSDVKAFYAQMESIGIDYKGLITAAKTTHGLTDDEAHAIFGYTTKLFYRPLNEALEAGGNPNAEALSDLIKSGLQKMPASASPVQYRGWRFEGADKVAREQAFDAKFRVGNDVTSGGFWSTGPDAADSYPGGRNVVINTTSAKDISDLAFGVHFHGLIGKPAYASETIIAPGTSFAVDGVDNSGPVPRLILNEH